MAEENAQADILEWRQWFTNLFGIWNPEDCTDKYAREYIEKKLAAASKQTKALRSEIDRLRAGATSIPRSNELPHETPNEEDYLTKVLSDPKEFSEQVAKPASEAKLSEDKAYLWRLWAQSRFGTPDTTGMSDKEFMHWLEGKLLPVIGEGHWYVEPPRADTERTGIKRVTLTADRPVKAIDLARFMRKIGEMFEEPDRTPPMQDQDGATWDEQGPVLPPMSSKFKVNNTSDEATFLRWIYSRLHHVHKEDESVDYMLRLKEVIASVEKVFKERSDWEKVKVTSEEMREALMRLDEKEPHTQSFVITGLDQPDQARVTLCDSAFIDGELQITKVHNSAVGHASRISELMDNVVKEHEASKTAEVADQVVAGGGIGSIQGNRVHQVEPYVKEPGTWDGDDETVYQTLRNEKELIGIAALKRKQIPIFKEMLRREFIRYNVFDSGPELELLPAGDHQRRAWFNRMNISYTLDDPRSGSVKVLAGKDIPDDLLKGIEADVEKKGNLDRIKTTDKLWTEQHEKALELMNNNTHGVVINTALFNQMINNDWIMIDDETMQPVNKLTMLGEAARELYLQQKA